MSTLNPNWITEKHIDFEYKKYMLLAYLQHVNDHFTGHKLYPSLTELVTHYRNVVTLRENKKIFYDSFPQRMSAADFTTFKLIYEKILEDDELMQHLEEIISFSIPQFEKHLAEGKKIYDFLESHLEISPVGIVPLHNKEGYLFLSEKSNRETGVYEYAVTLFEGPEEKYRGIYTSFIGYYEKSINNTFENMKSELISFHRKLPNPAAYAIETDISIPVEETFLPMAKRVLMKYVSA